MPLEHDTVRTDPEIFPTDVKSFSSEPSGRTPLMPPSPEVEDHSTEASEDPSSRPIASVLGETIPRPRTQSPWQDLLPQKPHQGGIVAPRPALHPLITAPPPQSENPHRQTARISGYGQAQATHESFRHDKSMFMHTASWLYDTLESAADVLGVLSADAPAQATVCRAPRPPAFLTYLHQLSDDREADGFRETCDGPETARPF
ncbi:hypothetical protein IAU60_002991 [Kwoniella sp. DSM 27419]